MLTALNVAPNVALRLTVNHFTNQSHPWIWKIRESEILVRSALKKTETQITCKYNEGGLQSALNYCDEQEMSDLKAIEDKVH